MIDGYEKHTCTECETMFTSNEELQQHHSIDHGLIIENSIEWTDVQPEDRVEETDDGFTADGKKITFSDEDKSIAESYLTETAKLQRVMVASEQRLKMARDQIKSTEKDTDEFYEQILGESNGQDFSSGAGTVNPLDTPKFKYSKNNKLADTINTKGYNPNPNAGLYDNKEFKEGGDHLEDPLAKEDFEVSFYGKESKASEDFSSSLDFDEPYPDPECKICGKVMINVWGDTRNAQDWNEIETAIQSHYIGVHGDDATTQELSDNEITKQNIIFWGESKASERLARDGEQTYYGWYGNLPSDAVPQTGDCPNCGHDVGQHSGASTGDTLCYGGGDGILGEGPLGGCPCGVVFPYIKESKASEEIIADPVDTINNTHVTDEEAELLLYGTTDGSKGKTWTGNVSYDEEGNVISNESKATEDQHTDAWDEKYGQDLCPICKDSGNCNSMIFHAKLWNDVKEKPASEFGDYEVKCDCDKDPDCKTCGGKGTNTWSSTVGKSDESLKADWDDSGYEEKYSWLKDLGVEDAFKYANMTLYELPEPVWKVVNEDYVQGFKQMTSESYKPDQKDTVETSEEKIISRKLDGTPVGQIARELVLWDNMSEDEAEKMVSETEPSDDDMSAKSLFNKKYSELNENELAEMELYDA